MKAISIYKIILLSVVSLCFNAMYGQQSCEDFQNGSVQAWQGQAANVTVQPDILTPNNLMLQAVDRQGDSWLFNTSYNAANASCATICWSYRVINDGLGGTSNIAPSIRIYQNSINDPGALYATFTANFTVNQGGPWTNLCAPIEMIVPGNPLPSNAFGAWTMAPGQPVSSWNILVNNFTGVAFKVDVAGSGNQTEVIAIDSFCVTNGTCCPPINPQFSLSAVCNNGSYDVTVTAADPGIQHSWTLMLTPDRNATTGGTPYGPVLNGNSVTFTGLDISKYFYVQHTASVSVPGCPPSILSVAVPIPEVLNSFVFQDDENHVNPPYFCYGEDVYLNGTASDGENAYWIGISRKPIGSSGPASNYSFLGWTTNAQIGVVNLSQLYAEQNEYYFEPGYTYIVKLALQNVQNCVAWTELEHSFDVVCCENTLSAAFRLDDRPILHTNNFLLLPVEYETYAHVDAQHEWYIFSADDDSGPYTLETVLSEAYFEYVIEGDRCYEVIHHFTTSCGEACFRQRKCNNTGLLELPCEVCGPIDCSELEGACIAPDKLQVDCERQSPYLLQWDAVNGVSKYIVEITFNDPACCETENLLYTISFDANTNALPWGDVNSHPIPVWSCFRWRVAAVCQDKSVLWSDYKCFTSCVPGAGGRNTATMTAATIVPNPATNAADILFETPYTGQVSLLDAVGRTVEEQTAVNADRLHFNLSRLPTGVYFFSTRNASGNRVFKLVKQ